MIAVIGDVHGCFHTFEALYYRVIGKYPGIEIYCVGDLVDRGSYSLEVVDFFLRNHIKITLGNHDYMFSAFVREPESTHARSWIFIGNEATLRSYSDRVEFICPHIDYLMSSPLYYNTEDCVISHAGISKSFKKYISSSKELDSPVVMELIRSYSQEKNGVLWNRERLLSLDKMQVVGHNIQDEVKFDLKSNAVYIDTGAFMGNKLSAVVIHKSEVLEVLAEPTKEDDMK